MHSPSQRWLALQLPIAVDYTATISDALIRAEQSLTIDTHTKDT